jgi:hypothetical protein
VQTQNGKGKVEKGSPNVPQKIPPPPPPHLGTLKHRIPKG